MSDQPIVPPVPEDVLKAVESEVSKIVEPEVSKAVESPEVEAELSAVQKLAASDKSSAVAAVMHVAIPLTAALGLHLSGSDVAILSALASSGITYFVGLNFRTRSKLSK